MGYSLRLTARVLLYAPSHRQDSTYHSLCYTSCGALAGMRNSSMSPQWRIDPTTHHTMSERSYHRATFRSLIDLTARMTAVPYKSGGLGNSSRKQRYWSAFSCTQTIVHLSLSLRPLKWRIVCTDLWVVGQRCQYLITGDINHLL